MNQCALLTIWTSLFTSALILQYLESVCSYFTVLWISLLYWPYEHHSYPVTSWAGWTPWCLYDVPSTKKSNTSAYMQFALKLIERQSIEISQNCFTRQGKKANFDQNQNVKRYLVTFFWNQSYLNKNSPFYKPWRFSHRHLPPLQYQSHLHVLLKL